MNRCFYPSLFLLTLIVAGHPAAAQEKQQTPQQERARKHRQKLKSLGIRVARAPVAKSDAVETRLDVVYARYGDRKMHLDLFLPRERSDKTATVLVVHGGGWFKGDRKSFHALSANLAMRGYIAAAIEYRLADEAKFPAAIHDCNAATRWLRANANDLGIDPDRIAAVGGSAGGHLVGLMGAGAHREELQGRGGNANQSSKLQAVVVFAGPMQMTTGSVAERSRQQPKQSNSNRWLGKSIDEAPELYALASPFRQLTSQTPPMMFAAGELDKPERNQPTRDKLRQLDVASKVVAYRYGLHGCWNQEPWFYPMVSDVDDFLRSVLGEPGGKVQPLMLGQEQGLVAFHDRIELQVPEISKQAKISMPRLNNRVHSAFIKGTEEQVPVKPGLTTWELTVPSNASGKTIVVRTFGQPHLPVVPRIVSAADDGSVTLAAHDSVTHGELLRYEPQPHKNCVGYWANPSDWVEWHFYSEKSGQYDLHVLQGCGDGHGGSEVEVQMEKQKLSFLVEDTGHFQNFKDRSVGRFTLSRPGVYTVRIRAVSKAKIAVMDVRQVQLVPVD